MRSRFLGAFASSRLRVQAFLFLEKMLGSSAMNSRSSLVFALVVAAASLLRAQAPAQRSRASDPPPPNPPGATVTVSEAMLKGLAARSIGPAVMGGRISDIAFDPDNPWTFYVATAHRRPMETARQCRNLS